EPGPGSDATEQRERRRADPQAGDRDCPGRGLLILHSLVALDEALLLECLQVAHDAVRRRDAERLADLTDRRRESAVLDLVADEVENLVLAFRDRRSFTHDIAPSLGKWRAPRERSCTNHPYTMM